MPELAPSQFNDSAESVEFDEPSDEELITGEAVALDLRPAGIVLRTGGGAIDVVLYLGSWFLGLLAFASAAESLRLDDALFAAVNVATFVLFLIVAPITVETLSHGKSLGKLAVGARIVRDDGGAITLRHAFVRGLIGVFENYTGFAFLVGLFNSKAKRLGDMLAGTYSQHERFPEFSVPLYGVPISLGEWAKTADVARMPDALSRRIAQFLAQARGLSPDTRVRLAAQLANEASAFVSPLPRAEPELFLAGVAAIRREREFAALQGERRRLETLRPTLSGLPHRFPKRTAG